MSTPKKNLICIVGELRAPELTFESFQKNICIPNNADLLLCIPDDKTGAYKNNLYYKNAHHIKVFDSSKNITSYYEEICKNLNGAADWKKLMHIKKFWLGGIQDRSPRTVLKEIQRIIKHSQKTKFQKGKDTLTVFLNLLLKQKGPLDQPSGAGFVLLYRHLLLEMIKEGNLHETYERFIITRSDHLYAGYHPLTEQLDPTYVWIPEGEDWRGYCDRHWILSKQHLEPCLDLLRPIFCQTNTLFDLMKHKYDWNSESYIKLIFEFNKIQVKRFPRTQFLVRGSTQSTPWTKGVYKENIHASIAYPTEYELAILNSEKFKEVEDWQEYFKRYSIN